VGNTLVTKALSGRSLGGGGLRILSNPVPCADPCDPNGCTLASDGPADVDASGVVATEAGLALVGVVSQDGGSSACVGLACQVAACHGGATTTLTGVVRDPAGKNPLYNAYVYVPVDPSGNLPPFGTGASCDWCAGAGSLDAIAATQTGPDGTFTLRDVPTTDLPPNAPVPLVVQMGKWRRLVMLTSVPACHTTVVPADSARLPRSRFDGFGGQADLPKMAIATGAVDPFECLLLKIGIDPAEFEAGGAPGPGRVDYYVANGQGIAAGSAAGLGALAGSLGTLMGYDVVILPCEGMEDDGTNTYADNMSSYANLGGRLFASHFGYTWLSTPTAGVANATNPATGNPNPFFGVASWNLSHASFTSELAAIDTGFPKGLAFSQWLLNVGATAGPQILLQSPRWDVDAVRGASTEWMHDTAAPDETFHFTFDTPVSAGADGGGGTCGRVVFSDFHVSTADLTSGGNCKTDADCGFTATCQSATEGTCTPVACVSVAQCPDPSYACNGGAPGTCAPQPCARSSDCSGGICLGSGFCGCRRNRDCSSGPCDTTTHTCVSGPPVACATPSDCGASETCQGAVLGSCSKGCAIDADCTRGELCVASECQGCAGPLYCPSGSCNGGNAGSCTASGSSFPLSCSQTPMSPQEDALEFMLFDLTACVSPDTSPPPPPSPAVVTYKPATFTVDYSKTCPTGTRPVWRELDWQATIPPGASIVFTAQTTPPSPDGGAPSYAGVQSVVIADAATSTALPGFDAALIDVTPGGAFEAASPPVVSAGDLRLTITLEPTSNALETPTLLAWQVKADCLAAE
jgi:hypothetical protein